jgi:mediator of replication checkpoint protein 1
MEETELGLADSGSDDEMPGIADILAEKQARESLREQKERLQKLKLAVLAQQQQKKNASTDAAADAKADGDGDGDDDDDDDGLDVVLEDTMHSVARQEAAARAKAGRSRPSSGRAMQLRMARVASSPPQQRAATQRHHLTSTSPEKRMAAAAQSTFLALANSSSGNNGSGAVRSGTTIGMSKDELERMVLRRAEAQSERLRREKEEEWVRRGGRVVSVMQVVGDNKVRELIGEALERGEEGARASARDGDDDEDDDDGDGDGDYVPPGEGGSASPQPQLPIEAEELGDDGEAQTHAMDVLADEPPAAADDDDDDNHGTAEEATSEEVESHVLTDEVRLRQRPHAARARFRRAIICSDDDDEGQQQLQQSAADEDLEEADPPPLSLPDLPSPAFTSTASPWFPTSTEPDHDNHENDPDVSGNDTDKENRAVVRRDDARPAPAHGARVLFDDLLSASASGTTKTTMASAVQPLPLLQPSVFAQDDDPFAFTPSPAKARDEALRRLESPTPPPMRVFDVAAAGTGKRGLSQLFEDEKEENGDANAQRGGGDNGTATQNDGLMGFKPALGSLSEAFEQTQVNAQRTLIFSNIWLNDPYQTHLRKHQGQGPGLEQMALRRCVVVQTRSFHSRLKPRRRHCSLLWKLMTAYARGQPRFSRKNRST